MQFSHEFIIVELDTTSMLGLIIVILIILWVFGYVNIIGFIPDLVLFNINGQPITLWNLLILAVVSWAISILPSPIREIAAVLLLLWILSVLGILAFGGLSSLLVVAIIVGLVLSFLHVI